MMLSFSSISSQLQVILLFFSRRRFSVFTIDSPSETYFEILNDEKFMCHVFECFVFLSFLDNEAIYIRKEGCRGCGFEDAKAPQSAALYNLPLEDFEDSPIFETRNLIK